MPDQEKDQVSEPKHGPKTSHFDERYDAGWKAYEELVASEKVAAEKKSAPPAEDDECSECDQAEKDRRKAAKAEKAKAEKKPYKILKVQGKEIPVYSEQELIDMAQMGADYTKKTQALAQERKDAEAAVEAKAKELESKASEVNKLIDKLEKSGMLGTATTKEEKADQVDAVLGGSADKSDIYKEFEIDPAFAQPEQKKMVEAIYKMRKDLEQVNAFVTETKNERLKTVFEKVIAEEREKYPYDDIKNDQGQNLTDLQFNTIVTFKRRQLALPDGQQPTMEQAIQIVRDSVKELHSLQKKSKEAGVADFHDDMTELEFIEKHPDLASKLRTKFAAEAVVESESKKSKVPPSLTPVAKGVETKQTRSSEKRKSFSDYLDAGFEDPETVKAITGG